MDFKRGDLVIKNVQKVFTVTYEGKGVSNNTFYTGGNSRKGYGMRMGLKKKYGTVFFHLLNECEDIEWMEEYKLIVYYNSRHDPGNVSGMEKFFSDALKQDREGDIVTKKGWVYDDSKKYCRGVYLIPDEKLKTNTFEFKILKLK